ncbi:MAG: hypothetical protein JXL80_09205 [Planctomycetes bacterium]|nr:hypothetical protein [Planctomycetota bacterium]
MTAHRRRVLIVLALIVTVYAATVSAADTPSRKVPETQPVVLDTYGFWRMYHALQPPVIADRGKLAPITYGYQWMDMATADVPQGWTDLEFDDSTWLRGPGRMSARTPYLSRLCMRGYFSVTDPSQVKGLTLTLLYQGGAAVYLNGKEIARGHLAAGKSMAEPYPLDAFVDAKGALLRGWDKAEKDLDADTKRRVALRVRKLDQVRVPAGHLRKGTNGWPSSSAGRIVAHP